jgi:methionyl-tRNA formyltransferase
MRKILVCGRSRVAEATLANIIASNELALIGYVTPNTNTFIEGSLQVCIQNGIPIYPNHHVATSETSPDYILSIYYDRIFEADFILNSSPLLNVHNSLLPTYRGMRPIDFALKNNEKHIGVTIHKIDSGIDTGDILAQSSFVVSEGESPSTAREKCFDLAIPLIFETLEKIDAIVPIQQNDDLASYYSKKDLWKLN